MPDNTFCSFKDPASNLKPEFQTGTKQTTVFPDSKAPLILHYTIDLVRSSQKQNKKPTTTLNVHVHWKIYLFSNLKLRNFEERRSFEWPLLQYKGVQHLLDPALSTSPSNYSELLSIYRMCFKLATHLPRFSLKNQKVHIQSGGSGSSEGIWSDCCLRAEIPSALLPSLWACLLYNWMACLVNWPSKDAQKGAVLGLGSGHSQMTWWCVEALRWLP